MNDHLEALRLSIETGNHYASLFLALAIPSLCGALGSADGEDSKAKYIGWYDHNVRDLALNGASCYALRCAILHQGRATHRNLGYTRVLFTFPGGRICAHNNVFNDALNLDIAMFAQHMLNAGRNWVGVVVGTEPFETNLRQSMHLRPDGLRPFINGVPVIT